MSIKLECGDPAIKPATYTCFVLPFAYYPTYIQPSEVSIYYEENKPKDILWRKKYLTYETANVLFNKAKWFTLNDSQSSKYPLLIPFKFGNTKEIIDIRVKPPSLILFEYPEDQKTCTQCEITDDKSYSVDDHNVLRIGFLVVETYFSNQNTIRPSLDNLLEFNEIFRYWQKPFMGHTKQINDRNIPVEFGSEDIINGKCDPYELYLKRWADLLDKPINITIKDGRTDCRKLIPYNWMCSAKKYVSGEDVTSPGWAIYSDNRTFVWTCAIIEGGGNALRENFDMPRARAWDFGHWIKLLNVDKPGKNINETHQSRDFEKEWAKERTYKRWEEWGTFYGFNYHCGAMIGPVCTEPPLWQHFRQMYFDQTLLLLYIRVTTFRFSMDLNRISNDMIKAKDKDISKWRKKFQKLRLSFALFTNLYQFPLLSNQQQAIEMYSLARKHMDIDDLFKEVKEEIDNCHEYFVAEEGIEQSSRMEKLTLIATIGLAFSITFAFWGMSIIATDLDNLLCIGQKILYLVISLLGVLLLSLVFVFRKSILWFLEKLRRRK